MIHNKCTRSYGFTLVELVVVATILAILGAIGFSAYTSYISGSRDTNRIVELSSIRAGLQNYAINSESGLPLPTSSVTILDGVEVVGYQGYASQEVLDSIDLKKGGKDPLDGTYYTYYVSESRNHFQLLGFLEEENSDLSSGLITHDVQAVDYSLRFPTVTGEALGIMVGTGTNTNIPIQEIDQITITDNGILDISSTTLDYSAIIKNDYIVSGDNTKLGVVASLGRSGGQIRGNCKELIESNPGLIGKDGSYFIRPDTNEDGFEAYCDMTKDGGGWTMILHGTDADIAQYDSRGTSEWNTGNTTIPFSSFNNTFKFTDSIINTVRGGGKYRIDAKGDLSVSNTYFVKPTCIYDQDLGSNGDCSILYNDINFTSLKTCGPNTSRKGIRCRGGIITNHSATANVVCFNNAGGRCTGASPIQNISVGVFVK